MEKEQRNLHIVSKEYWEECQVQQIFTKIKMS